MRYFFIFFIFPPIYSTELILITIDLHGASSPLYIWRMVGKFKQVSGEIVKIAENNIGKAFLESRCLC